MRNNNEERHKRRIISNMPLKSAIKKALKDRMGWFGTVDIACIIYAMPEYGKSVSQVYLRNSCDELAKTAAIRSNGCGQYSFMRDGDEVIEVARVVAFTDKELALIKRALLHVAGADNSSMVKHIIRIIDAGKG